MEEELRNSQLAFIGKILSTATHEFKNHLAIINESAGLMGDLMSMDSSMDTDKRERYLKIIGSIEKTVAKGSDMTQKLNRFGHRLDHPMAQFDINELLSEELRLLERVATQKQLTFVTDFEKSLPAINSYPGLWQYLFYKMCDFVFDFGLAHSTITIMTLATDSVIKLSITVSGLKEVGSDLFEQIRKDCDFVLAKIPGQLAFDQEKEEVTFLFTPQQ